MLPLTNRNSTDDAVRQTPGDSDGAGTDQTKQEVIKVSYTNGDVLTNAKLTESKQQISETTPDIINSG